MPSLEDQAKFRRLERFIKAKAEELRTGAAYAGSWGDNGAGDLLTKLQYWIAGLNGRIPEGFLGYAKEVEQISDPDWEKYQELKKKFEG